ncbi:hypothetical protein A9Q02_05415 [Candidatus Chloroploca asiatica]|uniref:Uncharacterized protein n=1 Tax=Candidatus Chloroploca asiatica TaxID=1506545 RepID=A0A2H3L1J0_9CHLR|nr:hypothetical protein A9Q02_05415 [Candidatus Chloroploca asiatica]
MYAGTATGPLYTPFQLEIDPMQRLLLINFGEDPDAIYLGFEPQVFDDERHGTGLIVIAWRVDGKVDVYHQPGVRLDPATYAIAGDGLNLMLERPLADASFRVTETGVEAAFAFEDALGRSIEVAISERNPAPRRPFGLLAPMGQAATSPSALPLVLLHDFYFVRQAATEVTLLIDGKSHTPDKMPVPIDGTRMYFMRYSPDPVIATLNPAYDGPMTPLEHLSATEARLGELTVELGDNQGQPEITQLRRSFNDHEVTVAFTPPLPNLVNLAEGASTSGIFTIAADPSVGQVIGEYALKRQGSTVTLEAIPSGGWYPNESKWTVQLIYLMAADFTAWPRSYRWTATLDLTHPSQATMQSRWERITPP